MRGYIFLSFIAVFAISNFAIFSSNQNFDIPSPKRQATVIESFTENEWWLLAWADNNLACKVLTEEEGLPGLTEVKADCGAEVYRAWTEQSLCFAAANGTDTSACAGFYLYYIGSHPAEREVLVELPPASVSITLAGCTQGGPGEKILCPNLPVFRLVGLEPLAEYQITQIHYERLNHSGVCEGAVCELPPRPTPSWGEHITFWADSSYGDSSEKYDAFVRVQRNADGLWQVDVLSEQVSGIRTQAEALEWQAFPPLGENPDWLSYPVDAAALASSEPYQYLAGQLIQARAIDASSCEGGGLLFDGYASQCGLESAMSEVVAWQNRFDSTIFEVADRYGLSPQLLKNLIAQESQFWPGWYETSPHEYGLARLTETGTDTLFRWNDGFYASFCSQILSEEVCAGGYNHLLMVHQEMLRGALATRVNVYCEPCQYGFDLGRVDFGIEVLAQSLLANAVQVNQMFVNLTGEKAGASSSYEDLWRFTLVNYNAGPGCLAAALKATVKGHAELNWVNVSANLVGGCQDAIGYVENIAK
jgi:hypothetical protein